jgi:hypothetical protein
MFDILLDKIKKAFYKKKTFIIASHSPYLPSHKNLLELAPFQQKVDGC